MRLKPRSCVLVLHTRHVEEPDGSAEKEYRVLYPGTSLSVFHSSFSQTYRSTAKVLYLTDQSDIAIDGLWQFSVSNKTMPQDS